MILPRHIYIYARLNLMKLTRIFDDVLCSFGIISRALCWVVTWAIAYSSFVFLIMRDFLHFSTKTNSIRMSGSTYISLSAVKIQNLLI